MAVSAETRRRFLFIFGVDLWERNTLFIVRGLPGSGKSTFCNRFLRGILHYENDMFQMDGLKYDFRGERQRNCIDFCYRAVSMAIENFGATVAVSNTFTVPKYLDEYYSLAARNGWQCATFRMEGIFGNEHAVPQDVLDSMARNFDVIESEIRVIPTEHGYDFRRFPVGTPSEFLHIEDGD